MAKPKNNPAKKQPKRRHKPAYGEGSFSWDSKNRIWVGRYDTGTTNSAGRRVIIKATSRDEDTAWQKFLAAKKKYLIEGPRLEGVKANQTVKGWAAEWLPVHEKAVRSGPFMTDRGNINNWIIPQIGGVRLEDLTAAHMRKVGAAPLAQGKSTSTAHSAQRTLAKMLRAAIADGYKVPERILAAKKVTIGANDRTAMSKEEVTRVFSKAYETYPDAVRFFMAVIYGSRKSEVLGLPWECIVFDEDAPAGALVVGKIVIDRQVQSLRKKADGTYHVPDGEAVEHLVDSWHFTPPKTGAGVRELPLIAPVARELLAWKQQCPTGDANPWDLVFPRIRGKEEYLGYPRNKQADLREWKQLQAAAGVYKRPPAGDDPGEFYLLHEARHSMISMLADAGIPKHIIEMLVGQTELVGAYVHGSDEIAAAAVSDVLAPLLPSSGS